MVHHELALPSRKELENVVSTVMRSLDRRAPTELELLPEEMDALLDALVGRVGAALQVQKHHQLVADARHLGLGLERGAERLGELACEAIPELAGKPHQPLEVGVDGGIVDVAIKIGEVPAHLLGAGHLFSC